MHLGFEQPRSWLKKEQRDLGAKVAGGMFELLVAALPRWGARKGWFPRVPEVVVRCEENMGWCPEEGDIIPDLRGQLLAK